MCVAAVALIVVGLVLPAWRDDGDVVRVVNAGYLMGSQLASSGGSDGEDVAFGVAIMVGFLGLLVVSVVAACMLAAVAFGEGRLPSARRLRRTVGILAIVGSVIASLISLLTLNAETPETGPGWGPVVLLVGAILYRATVTSKSVEDLRFQAAPGTGASVT